MEPDVLRHRNGIQCSYTLPHRAYDSRVYPRTSANGSTVIVYGHETGIRAVWYAGKRSRSSPNEDLSRANSNKTHTISSENDGLSGEIFEELESSDVSEPYGAVRYHDILLGSAVLHLDIPPVPSSVQRSSSDYLPTVVESCVVIAAACVDGSIQIVSLPLDTSTMEVNKEEVSIVKITGSDLHRDLICGIAVTWTAEISEQLSLHKPGAVQQGHDPEASVPQVNSQAEPHWSLLIATSSATGTGLLSFHQVMLDKKSMLHKDAEVLLLQCHLLRSPMINSRMSFSPAIYPADGHSHLLVTMPDMGAVRIYAALAKTSQAKQRRGSTATATSSTSTVSGNKSTNAFSGKCCLTLYSGFEHVTETNSIPNRKRVLDAQWLSQGRGILTLLENGEWGVWDVEAAGHISSIRGLSQGQSSISGVQGGSITKFSVKGTVGIGPVVTKTSDSTGNKSVPSALAPMTPHTRKTRSEGLFQATEVIAVTRSIKPRKGSIAVATQPCIDTAGRKDTDEVVMLSYDSAMFIIPSVQAIWRSEGTRNESLESCGAVKTMTLPHLQLAGEQLLRLTPIPNIEASGSNDIFAYSTASRDLIVLTSSRLILFTTQADTSSVSKLPNHGLSIRPHAEPLTSIDQTLLTQGELDVDGMERILDSMTNSSTNIGAATGFEGKNGGVHFTMDEDADMDSPVPKSSRSKLLLNGTSKSTNGRTLFS